MAKPIPEEEIQTIESIVSRYSDGASISEIMNALDKEIPRRTLTYRLAYLVDTGRLTSTGTRRATKYKIPPEQTGEATETLGAGEESVQLEDAISKEGAKIRKKVSQPIGARKPVGYRREFLESYQPNVTEYLPEKQRDRLREIGAAKIGPQPAGTYAKQILRRLLVDLSWNSSRMEGNTYSLLDTKRLIEFGEAAQGKNPTETQMILNHKDAIEFLTDSPDDIGFDRYTICNLHALLARNLLTDPDMEGSLRRMPVGIGKSVFHPPEIPQLIEECLDRVLASAQSIIDPFEQAFFVMVHLPYLQPFDDVNKRVSRLAANMPLIKANLAPLSFIDVPQSIYIEAILGVYELNKVDLLRDVFVWAYERSTNRYAAVRQTTGEPDPFRLKHLEKLREVVGEIVRDRLGRRDSFARIRAQAGENIESEDREQFREVAEAELLSLHEGNCARHRITAAEFRAWQQAWTAERDSAESRS